MLAGFRIIAEDRPFLLLVSGSGSFIVISRIKHIPAMTSSQALAKCHASRLSAKRPMMFWEAVIPTP